MRFKRRYFCVELLADVGGEIAKIKPSDLQQEFSRSIEKFFGDFGVATMQPSFSLIYFNANTSLAVFRVGRDHRVMFHQLVTLMRRVSTTECTFRVVHVSGSIKKCKKFLLGYSHDRLNELYREEATRKTDRSAAVEVLEKLIKACEEDGEYFY